MADATAVTTTPQRKGKATNSSTSWDVVERYAQFLVEKFGDRISTKLWDSTKAECTEKGIHWISNVTLKRCLGHYAVCDHAPIGTRQRATAYMKQLSRPDLMDPWQLAPARVCPYCINREEAVVAKVLEGNAEEFED
jgi:hypothetical protein